MSGRRGRSVTRSGSARNRGIAEQTRSRSRSPIARTGTMAARPPALDQELPGNWTTSKLKTALKKKGITLPTNTPHKTLLKLYEQLNKHGESVTINRSEPSHATPEITTQIDDVINQHGGAHELTNSNAEQTRFDQLQGELLVMQANMAEIRKCH